VIEDVAARRKQLNAATALLLRVALVSFGYYLTAYIGTVLSLPPSGFAIVWPATALLLGVLLMTPVRDWWAYLAALVPAHFQLVGHVQAPHTPFPPLSVTLTQLGGNFSLAAVSALAVKRLAPVALRVDSFRGALTFIVVAGVAAPAVMNALILSLHLATGWTQDFWLSWRQWMLSCIFPTITIVPLALLARKEAPASWASRLELGLLCAGLFTLGFTAYGGSVAPPYWPTLLLAPLPLLLWAAVRCGVFGASLSVLIFAAAIILRALQDRGPFAASSSVDNVLSLQVYLTAISISLILLAALEEDRRRAQAELRRSEERIQIAAASTDTGLWQWDRVTHRLWMTEHCRIMFGRTSSRLERLDAIFERVHPDDLSHVRKALEAVVDTGAADVTGEFRLLRADGEMRWFTFSTHGEKEPDGQVSRVSGVFRDITERIAAETRAEELSHRLQTLQEDERRTIAEELHDSTGQHLVAIGLTLGALERRLPDTDAQTLFADARGSLAKALKELRTFTYLLRPPELVNSGLTDVLRRYVEGFGRRTGLTTGLRISRKGDDLSLEQQRAVLRIAQECLTNVHRHAAASRVNVSLRDEADALHLLVRDNGRGMDGAALRDGSGRLSMGVGIPGMTARIRELGGRLVIRSSPKGTLVHVVVPKTGRGEPPAPAPRRRDAGGLVMSRRMLKGAGRRMRIRPEGR
jgi:PAS domain S-box-containing protein